MIFKIKIGRSSKKCDVKDQKSDNLNNVILKIKIISKLILPLGLETGCVRGYINVKCSIAVYCICERATAQLILLTIKGILLF